MNTDHTLEEVGQRFLLIGGDFVVGHADALTAAAILPIEAHDGVSGRARAREEVENERAGP